MNKNTLLHRQINPAWVVEGRVTSQAFKPMPKDNKRLSVYDGEQIAPDASWLHFTQEQGFKSIGVRSVSIQECESLQLAVAADPKPFPQHVVICFDACSSMKQIEKKAKKLNRCAEMRGWLYLDEEAG